jgi:hypothetical protein
MIIDRTGECCIILGRGLESGEFFCPIREQSLFKHQLITVELFNFFREKPKTKKKYRGKFYYFRKPAYTLRHSPSSSLHRCKEEGEAENKTL